MNRRGLRHRQGEESIADKKLKLTSWVGKLGFCGEDPGKGKFGAQPSKVPDTVQK
jgi:hypothetical protein